MIDITNFELKEELLTPAWIYWKTSSNNYMARSVLSDERVCTGNPRMLNAAFHGPTTTLSSIYIEYIPEDEKCVIIPVCCSGKRKFEDTWHKYCERYLEVYKDGTVKAEHGTSVTVKYAQQTINAWLSAPRIDPKYWKQEFKKLWPFITTDNYIVGYPCCFHTLLAAAKRAIKPSKSTTDVADYLDVLDKRPMPEITHTGITIYGEELDENTFVFREFARKAYYYGANPSLSDIAERNRVFIHKGKVIIFEGDSVDNWRVYTSKWIRITSGLRSSHFRNPHENEEVTLYLPPVESIKQKNVRYIYPLITDTKEHKNPLYKIANILRHPFLEALLKSDCPSLFKCFVVDNEVAANLKRFTDQKEKKSLTVSQLLGINNRQLRFLEEKMKELIEAAKREDSMRNIQYGYYNDEYNSRQTIRYAYPLASLKALKLLNKDIASMDDNTFKQEISANINICKACNTDNLYYGYTRLFKWLINPSQPTYYSWYYRNKEMDMDWLFDSPYTSAIKRWVLKANQTMCVTLEQIGGLYSRIRRSYGPENLPVGINPDTVLNCKANELATLHDRLMELENVLRAEREREKNKEAQEGFEKLKAKRKKLFYYEDDKFIIRPAESPVEVTTEGEILHHCVGGYVGSVASGATNILFLRRKSSPNTPYFTIEVDNDKTVKQIHGKNNRWLGSDELDQIPFVYKWLREKGINCSTHILTCKATGYGGNAECVDLNEVLRQYA